MRKLTFKCVITSGLTPFIDLQQQSVTLQQDGTTWSGSLAVEVDATLNIAVTVNGINGSPWTVDITIDCPGGSPAKIFSRKGTITDGSVAFKTSAKVPAQPCAEKTEMMVVKAKRAPRKKTTQKKTAEKKTTKKKHAKAKSKTRRP